MKNHLSLLTLKTILQPMGKITSIIQDDYILFQKDNITFATDFHTKLDKVTETKRRQQLKLNSIS